MSEQLAGQSRWIQLCRLADLRVSSDESPERISSTQAVEINCGGFSTPGWAASARDNSARRVLSTRTNSRFGV